jgi:hypothetical protein
MDGIGTEMYRRGLWGLGHHSHRPLSMLSFLLYRLYFSANCNVAISCLVWLCILLSIQQTNIRSLCCTGSIVVVVVSRYHSRMQSSCAVRGSTPEINPLGSIGPCPATPLLMSWQIFLVVTIFPSFYSIRSRAWIDLATWSTSKV